MTDTSLVSYDVRLRLCGMPAGAAPELRTRIESALRIGDDASDGVEIIAVEEIPPEPAEQPRCATDAAIVPLSALYGALPTEFQRPEILDTLADRYHFEVRLLWNSVQDRRCVQPVIRLFPWRKARSQWICEFMSYDRSVPVGNSYNQHLQNTSQWKNEATGWHGHQGAIVFDDLTGDISCHH